MSDLLHKAGYTQVFLMAANLKFAGEGAYFMRHGFTRAYGGADIPPLAGQPDAPRSPWGVHDDVLFAAGLKEFRRLVKAGRPFNLEILTIDTHPPHGFPAPSCPRDGYRAPEGHEILFAVHCTDASLAAFIAQLRAEMPDNVILAVQNDHMMVNIPDTQGLLWPTVPKQITREDRLTVWGHGLSPRVVHRQGSMFDVAPTLYGLLGFPSTPIGFGRDLLGKRPTLIEQYGHPWMVDHMRSILSLPEFRSARRTDWDRPGGLKGPGE
jgi:phosphoglycerol transferase